MLRCSLPVLFLGHPGGAGGGETGEVGGRTWGEGRGGGSGEIEPAGEEMGGWPEAATGDDVRFLGKVGTNAG